MKKKNFFADPVNWVLAALGIGATSWLIWKTKKNYDEVTKEEQEMANYEKQREAENPLEMVDMEEAEAPENEEEPEVNENGDQKKPTEKLFMRSLFVSATYCKTGEVAEMSDADAAVQNMFNTIHFFQKKREDVYLRGELGKHQNREFLEVVIPFPDYLGREWQRIMSFSDCLRSCDDIAKKILREQIFGKSYSGKGNVRLTCIALVNIANPDEDFVDVDPRVGRFIEVPFKVSDAYGIEIPGRIINGVSKMFRAYKDYKIEDRKPESKQDEDKLYGFEKPELEKWLIEEFGKEADPICVRIIPAAVITLPIRDRRSQFGLTPETGEKILQTLADDFVIRTSDRDVEGRLLKEDDGYRYGNFMFHVNVDGEDPWNWFYNIINEKMEDGTTKKHCQPISLDDHPDFIPESYEED